ncbi:MAG: hypothetical protein AAGC97_16005 [Planctomycetota bacterium]
MIQKLRETIQTTEDYEVAVACIDDLGRMESAESIEALFDVYSALSDRWFDELAQKAILDSLRYVDVTQPTIRVVFVRHLPLLRDIISNRSGRSSYFWRDAIRILEYLADDSRETIERLQVIALDEGNPDDNEWAETRDDAVRAIDQLAPHVLQGHGDLARLLTLQQRRQDERMYQADDPIWFCNVCGWRFPRPKQTGFICDQCKAEVGVDDDHHYKAQWLARKKGV